MLDCNRLPILSAACEVRIPERDAKVEDFVSRWSNTSVSLPAAVITPTSEADVIATIDYATSNSLKVIPAAGAHGTCVPVNEQCIYLDMQHFNNMTLDETAGTVTIGGGVITRDIIRVLGERGFYTSVPNSNAVGMVGYCLGGGSSAFNGLKGLAVDHILRIRMVTAKGAVVEVGPESMGRERELFDVLCGAGFGFGVIISLTLRAWRVSELGMDEDRIWTRKLVFPPPAIEVAADLFTKLQHPEPKLTTALLFMRAPPSSPKPGAPMILLNVTYLGPSANAEEAAAATFDPIYTSSAIIAETTSAPLSTMNDMAEPLNRHGDYKGMYAAWLSSIPSERIVAAFKHWRDFGGSTPEAKAMSYVVFAAKSTQGLLAHDREGRKAFPRVIRGRSVFVQVVPWWTEEAIEGKARGWAGEMLGVVGAAAQLDGLSGKDGSGDEQEEVSGFAANMRKGMDLRTVWPKEKIEEIGRVKEVWDEEGVFWCPVVDGV